MRIRIALACFSILIFAFARVEASPRVDVIHTEMLAGSYQHVRFAFNMDQARIEAGGGVRIELPVAYLETGPYFWDQPQLDYPEGRGFVEADSTVEGELEMVLSGRRKGIVECRLKKGTSREGEKFYIHYRGVVQSYTWKLPVRAQWRENAEAAWKPVESAPTLQFWPLKAVILFAVIPADVQKGEDFDLAVVLLDKYGNRASRYAGTVRFASTDPDADLPGDYTFGRNADGGVHVFKGVRFNTEGFHKITLSDGTLEGRSNYSEVHTKPPQYKRYFGDTHFHTGTGTGHEGFTTVSGGGDHRGHFTSEEEAYGYARDVMRLDFASAAEHDGKKMNPKVWKMCQEVTDAYDDPGRFSTFYAYEWTAAAEIGHQLVLYKDPAGRVFCRTEYDTQPKLYEALDRQALPALVIPHMMWAQPDHEIWEPVNNHYRRIGEIYSLWNNRFLLQPGDEPQRFELGIENRWSYQYAWDRGHRIGVIGSSDNHTSHPGLNNYTANIPHPSGLAAVLAEANNRDRLWNALENRRTYATTGTRILLEFQSDGHWMGEEYSTGTPPTLTVKVAGTNTIQSVEIVKYDGKGYQTLYQENPDSEICVMQYQDTEFTGDSMYYARVTQVDQYWRSAWAKTTSEMAWSSPIWVAKEK